MNIKFDKPREECCYGEDANLFRFTDFYIRACKGFKGKNPYHDGYRYLSMGIVSSKSEMRVDLMKITRRLPGMLSIALEPDMGHEDIALAFTRLYFETYHGGEIPIDALNKQSITDMYYWNPTSSLCRRFNLSLHMFYKMLDGLGIPRSREKIYWEDY